jgi:hypothetical protein
MDGLRRQARKQFHLEQHFKQRAELCNARITLVTVAKFTKAETKLSLREVEWLHSKDVCDQINAGIPKHGNEHVTASMRMIRFERDQNGVIGIDQQTFMAVFEDCGFDAYWLNMILGSTYGFFSQHKLSGRVGNYYLHTVSYTMLWTHDSDTTITKAMLLPREHSQSPQQIFKSFLETLDHHKDLVNDARFCSLLCGVQVVRWIEGTTGENLKRIRDVEVITGHGAWHEPQRDSLPNADEFVTESKKLGFVLTALANVFRHACIARAILDDLASPQPLSLHQPLLAPLAKTTGFAPSVDDIVDAVEFLRGQTQSGELQASYLQERGRTQQSVVRYNTSPVPPHQLLRINTRFSIYSVAKMQNAAKKSHSQHKRTVTP